jgi:hypothetical protein
MTAVTTAPPVDEAIRLAALDAFFEVFYRRRPVTATFTGIHQYDHALPDFSPEVMQSMRSEMSAMRRRLAEAGFGVLHTEEYAKRDWLAIDGALADAVLDIKLAEDESRHFARGNPSLAVGEAVFSVVALAGATMPRLRHGSRRPSRDSGRFRISSTAHDARSAMATCRPRGAIVLCVSAKEACCSSPTLRIGPSPRECRWSCAGSSRKPHHTRARRWSGSGRGLRLARRRPALVMPSDTACSNCSSAVGIGATCRSSACSTKRVRDSSAKPRTSWTR